MPKTIVQFKSEFSKLKDLVVNVGMVDYKKHTIIMDRGREMFNQGASAVGQRVAVLKKSGYDGSTLKDFLFDAEVGELRKAIEGIINDRLKEVERARTATTGGLRRIAHDYDVFVAELSKEVDRFVKAKDPNAITFGSLLGDAKKFRNQQIDFFAYVRDGAVKFDPKKYWSIVDGEVQSTKVSREAMLNRQKLNPRNLNTAMTHVKALHDELLKQSAKYKAAIAKGDKAGANTALKVSAVIREKLDKVAAEHMKAFSDFKEEIANDKKDGSTVTKMMTQMVVWKKQSDSLKRMSAPV